MAEELKPGLFYWCDTGDEFCGFVLLESITGFIATVTSAGYGRLRFRESESHENIWESLGDPQFHSEAKFVHIECLSRKGLRRPKKKKVVAV